MDSVNDYRDVVERLLKEYAAVPYRHGDLTCEGIFDRERGRFVLLTVGWDGGQRVHQPVMHVEIIEDKLWIQANQTSELANRARYVAKMSPLEARTMMAPKLPAGHNAQLVWGFRSGVCGHDPWPRSPLPLTLEGTYARCSPGQ